MSTAATAQTPTIGRIVHVLVDPTHNNGIDVAPALITRVWPGRTEAQHGLGEYSMVNLRVIGESHQIEWLTSIALFDARPDADALAARNPQNPAGYHAVAFWPPQV